MAAGETIHVTEAEAARDLAGLLARVRSGVEIVIDGTQSSVRLSAVARQGGRLLSESIELAERFAVRVGYEPAMDAGYAADMQEIVAARRPRDTSRWD